LRIERNGWLLVVGFWLVTGSEQERRMGAFWMSNPFAGGPDNLLTYLVLAAFLFSVGVFTVISRHNAVGILMGLELILNAAGVNFVAFARFHGHQLDGQVFTLFIIVLAAAEAAVALALVLAVFQTHRNIEVDRADELRM
jgi:NADH-quinone oxidoreductase subunit K